MNFKAELKKQMRFIQGSAELYDMGNPDEAIRIATTLDVVFNDLGRYKILPDWISKQNLRMVSTRTKGIDNPKYMLTNMIQMELVPTAGIMRFRPSLNSSDAVLIEVGDWWKKEVIFRSGQTNITRKDLVLWARNTDGGAHIQKKDKGYEWLFSGVGWSMTLNPLGRPSRIVTAKNAHLACLRQIAFEVLITASLKQLWHPNWHATHRVRTIPDDNSSAQKSWDVMLYEGHAYTREEWEGFGEPQWRELASVGFELLGEPPCIGVIEIEPL